MTDNLAPLDRMIADLRDMPNMLREAKRELAATFEAELKRTANAGTTPEGGAWTPTADGKRPLPKAAERLTVRVTSDGVEAVLEGNEARHHKYRARGAAGKVRRVLPYRLDAKLAHALLAVLKRKYMEHMHSG